MSISREQKIKLLNRLQDKLENTSLIKENELDFYIRNFNLDSSDDYHALIYRLCLELRIRRLYQRIYGG